MGLADELWKLQEMHQRGELSDEEYARAKAAVLSGAMPGAGGQLEDLSRQMDEVARRQEVADIDRAWDQERLQFLATGTRGGTHDAHGHYVGGTPYQYIPSRGGSIGTGIFAAVVGVIWMIFTARIGGGCFALFGLVFIAFGIGMAVYNYNKAASYEEAHARYLRRRARALGEDAQVPFQNEPQQERQREEQGEERPWDDQPPDWRVQR
jgi:hypothetical protein